MQLESTAITDVGLAALGGLKNLNSLAITFTAVSTNGMDTVARLTNLRHLLMGESQVGDEGLSKLKSLSQLESIHMGGPVTDLGLAHLANFPNLTTVYGLKPHHLTPAGIERLKQVPKLTKLGVVGATDGDLELLKSLSNIEELGLNSQHFTSAAIATCRSFPKLQALNFNSNPNVDDSYLIQLAQLAPLRQLLVGTSKLTADGIAWFRDFRPDVELCVANKVYPASHSVDFTIERNVAEWAIGLKAGVQIKTTGGLQTPLDLSQLPNEPFHVNALFLDQQKGLNKNDLTLIAQLKSIKTLCLNGTPVDDSWMAMIGKMTTLQVLQLQFTAVTSMGVAELGELTDLEMLWLTFTSVSDEGMKAVAELKKLRSLGLGETQVGDGGLAGLASLRNLESLHIGAPVTDRGLEHLSRFPKLNVVAGLKSNHLTPVGISNLQTLVMLSQLNVVGATDEDLVRLKPLSNITYFVFNFNQFTSIGIESLEAFPKLQTLNLNPGANVDDTFLVKFEKFAALRTLQLGEAKVSPERITKFREARRDVELYIDSTFYPRQEERKSDK